MDVCHVSPNVNRLGVSDRLSDYALIRSCNPVMENEFIQDYRQIWPALHKFFITKTAILLFGFFIAGPSVLRGDDAIKSTGDVLEFALPTLALGMIDVNRDGEGLLQFGEAGLLALALTQGLKYSIDERRPNGGSYSFPSGHASCAFWASEFIRKRYGWEVGVPAYVAAVFVGYSRVEEKAHYTHDVLAGAAIGIGSSYLFTKPYKDWQLKAELGDGYYGLSLNKLW